MRKVIRLIGLVSVLFVAIGLIAFALRPSQPPNSQVLPLSVQCDNLGALVDKTTTVTPDSVRKICIEGRQALVVHCGRALTILWDIPMAGGHGPANPRACDGDK